MDNKVGVSARRIGQDPAVIVEEILPSPSALNPGSDRVIKAQMGVAKEYKTDFVMLVSQFGASISSVKRYVYGNCLYIQYMALCTLAVLYTV